MVETQLRRRGIHDERVLQATREIPREEFVPAESRLMAYQDEPIHIGHGQTISPSYMVAKWSAHRQWGSVRPGKASAGIQPAQTPRAESPAWPGARARRGCPAGAVASPPFGAAPLPNPESSLVAPDFIVALMVRQIASARRSAPAATIQPAKSLGRPFDFSKSTTRPA